MWILGQKPRSVCDRDKTEIKHLEPEVLFVVVVLVTSVKFGSIRAMEYWIILVWSYASSITAASRTLCQFGATCTQTQMHGVNSEYISGLSLLPSDVHKLQVIWTFFKIQKPEIFYCWYQYQLWEAGNYWWLAEK